MKKLLAILMSLVLLCSFAACGNKKVKNANGISTVTKGTLTVAISPDFAPMEFVDTSKTGQDQYVGFDPTLAKFIAESMGFTLVIKPLDFSACQTAVQTGKADISISGYAYTEERAENFLLSDPYYTNDDESIQTIIVPAEKAGTYSKAEDFKGLTVAAQSASLQMNLCNKQLDGIATIKEFGDLGTAVEALKAGTIDAIAVADGNGDAIISNSPSIGKSGFNFTIDDTMENNVILIQKGDTAMLEAVNKALANALAGGYYSGWYEEAKALAGISSAAEISYDEKGEVAK